MPFVGLLSLELHLPGSQSLKDKRVVLRSLKDRLRRLNVSFAEVDHQTLLQRSRLAIVAVGSEQRLVQRSLESVMAEVERKGEGVVVSSEVEWLS